MYLLWCNVKVIYLYLPRLSTQSPYNQLYITSFHPSHGNKTQQHNEKDNHNVDMPRTFFYGMS